MKWLLLPAPITNHCNKNSVYRFYQLVEYLQTHIFPVVIVPKEESIGSAFPVRPIQIFTTTLDSLSDRPGEGWGAITTGMLAWHLSNWPDSFYLFWERPDMCQSNCPHSWSLVPRESPIPKTLYRSSPFLYMYRNFLAPASSACGLPFRGTVSTGHHRDSFLRARSGRLCCLCRPNWL